MKVKKVIQREMLPKQKKFCDLVLEGYSQTDAYFLAGYLDDRDKTDRKARDRATDLASRLANLPSVKQYLQVNRKVEKKDLDINELIENTVAIALGRCEVQVITKRGEKVSVPPTFKDRNDATKILVNYYFRTLNSKVEEQDNQAILTSDVDALHKKLEKLKVIDVDVDEKDKEELDEDY